MGIVAGFGLGRHLLGLLWFGLSRAENVRHVLAKGIELVVSLGGEMPPVGSVIACLVKLILGLLELLSKDSNGFGLLLPFSAHSHKLRLSVSQCSLCSVVLASNFVQSERGVMMD